MRQSAASGQLQTVLLAKSGHKMTAATTMRCQSVANAEMLAHSRNCVLDWNDSRQQWFSPFYGSNCGTAHYYYYCRIREASPETLKSASTGWGDAMQTSVNYHCHRPLLLTLSSPCGTAAQSKQCDPGDDGDCFHTANIRPWILKFIITQVNCRASNF